MDYQNRNSLTVEEFTHRTLKPLELASRRWKSNTWDIHSYGSVAALMSMVDKIGDGAQLKWNIGPATV